MNDKKLYGDLICRLLLLSIALIMACGAIPSVSAGMYSVYVDLPQQNSVQNLVVTYKLPAGLIYNATSLSISGAVTNADSEFVSNPNNGSAVVNVTWTFNDVNNSGGENVSIQFDGIVANVTCNQDGIQLPPGTVSYDYTGSSGTKTGKSLPTSIVEPDLTIEKRMVINESNNVDYELWIYHTSESHSDAHDVLVTDVIPNGWSYVTDSSHLIQGPSGYEIAVVGPIITYRFYEIETSWNSSEKVKVNYTMSAGGGSSSSTSRTLNWSSANTTGYGQDRLYSLEYDETVLTVSITCSNDHVAVGDNITYNYTVTNVGVAAVNSIALTDDRLGSIALSANSLTSGQSANGEKNYSVQMNDYPGPLVNNATATGTDANGRSVSGVGTISVPFYTDPLFVKKTALNKTVSRGGNVTYKIEIYNTDSGPGAVPPTNIVVKDVFNKPVEFISASPEPDPDGLWRIPVIYPGEENKTVITLVVKVPEEQVFNFSSESSVSGEGFVNVADEYSTTLDPYPLKNCVYVTFFNGTTQKNETVSDCETVTVLGEAGTELSTREHGSGTYESADLLEMQTKNNRISLEKDMAASHATTTLGLYNNRTVTYSSKWTEVASAKNRITGTSMSESYRYASTIDRDSRIHLNENGSLMEIDSEFDGMGHIGILNMPKEDSTFKATPLFESSEDYSGSFRIVEKTDEYGSAVSSEKSASGEGLVSVDKRVGDSQRSYEYGSGTYDSEELIETYTNYIAKDISLVYAPTAQKISDSLSIEASQKWKEGIFSTTPGISYIGEEYTDLTKLDKETVARGLNAMNSEASFSGQARYRAIYASALENATTGETSIDFDDIYEGDYSLQRRLYISGVPKYSRPHLDVTKALEGVSDEAISGSEVAKVATYTITIENDGNHAVGPVRVQDLFPPGAEYVGASLRPIQVTATSANWTLTHLAIGDFAAIKIELDVTDCTGHEITNRVNVCGGDGDDLICASNFSTQETDWLSWPSSDGISIRNTAKLDEDNPKVVWYTIKITNNDNATRAATVTDRLPARMQLLDTKVPFASYDNGVVVWNLVDIGPSETKTIEFSALASSDGRYANTVEVDSESAAQPVSATCMIDVGTVDGEGSIVSCDGWQLPNWEFEHYGYGSDEATCEDLTCASYGGTDF